jgi:hypothetical protein
VLSSSGTSKIGSADHAAISEKSIWGGETRLSSENVGQSCFADDFMLVLAYTSLDGPDVSTRFSSA